MASNHGTVYHLLPPTYQRLVASWLEEDCPGFDYAGFVVGEKVAEARLMGKSPVSSVEDTLFAYHYRVILLLGLVDATEARE